MLFTHRCLSNEVFSLRILKSLREYRYLVFDKSKLPLDFLDLEILLLDNITQIHGLVLEPLERLLERVDPAVHLHLELLLSHCLLD